jgi:hypothetical protein
LPNWPLDIRAKPELRRFFLDLLDERSLGGALGTVLDPAAVESLKRAFFAAETDAGRATARPNPLLARLPMRMKQRLQATGLYPGSTNMAGGYPSRGTAVLVRSIALLSLLHRSLPMFGAAARPAAPTEVSATDEELLGEHGARANANFRSNLQVGADLA